MLSNQDPEALSHQKQKPAEAQSTCEAENNNPEAKPSEQIILNTLPDEKEGSLWENANLILTENTKNLEIFEHKNYLEILGENENNAIEKPETPINSNKLNLNSENQNDLLITQNNENIEMDSNEKESINNEIENINKFMDSSSAKNKKHSKNNVKSGNNKEKKTSKKIESKRLKALINDEKAYGDYMHTEGNNAEIHELKNMILRNNNFQSKKFKESNFIFNLFC